MVSEKNVRHAFVMAPYFTFSIFF